MRATNPAQQDQHAMPPVPGLYTHPRFLTADFLHDLCTFLDSAEGEAAAVQTMPGAPLAVAEEVRRAWEVTLPEVMHDELVARIRSVHGALEARFALRLEPCEGVAALRYPPGAFYRTHRDVSAHPDPYDLHRRALSVVMFLNTGAPHRGAAFTGGVLRLHELPGATGALDIVPVAGTLIAFPSSVLHEVTRVEAGTRASVVTWLLAADEVVTGAP